LSHSLNLGPKYRPPSLEARGSRHVCGCRSREAIRLSSPAGELRKIVGDNGPREEPLDTIINVAVVGGAAYLVYELFFG